MPLSHQCSLYSCTVRCTFIWIAFTLNNAKTHTTQCAKQDGLHLINHVEILQDRSVLSFSCFRFRSHSGTSVDHVLLMLLCWVGTSLDFHLVGYQNGSSFTYQRKIHLKVSNFYDIWGKFVPFYFLQYMQNFLLHETELNKKLKTTSELWAAEFYAPSSASLLHPNVSVFRHGCWRFGTHMAISFTTSIFCWYPFYR